MAKALAPVDMLKKCLAHFIEEAEKFRIAEEKAGTVWEKNVAREFGLVHNRFVEDIGATLRDWT